jgi:hypothetical protein
MAAATSLTVESGVNSYEEAAPGVANEPPLFISQFEVKTVGADIETKAALKPNSLNLTIKPRGEGAGVFTPSP